MATFKHTALKDNQRNFRVLEVYSGDGKELRANLTQHEVADRVPYEALSYAWGGDPDHTLKANEEPYIRIGTYYHRITWSLRGAIEVFRLPDRPRRLWIDQICIDQTKTDQGKLEKDGQLPLWARSTRMHSRR